MPRLGSLLYLLVPAILCGQQLNFATYQGGAGIEYTGGIAQDNLGNVYLAGCTSSTTFPVASTAGGGFIVKLSSSGSPVASTIIPGASIAAIALDASNNVVIAGTKTATCPTPDLVTGPGYVAKLNSALTQTLWTSSTFAATPTAMTLDATGVYVTGYAKAGFATTTGALQTATNAGGPACTTTPCTYNAFVLKLSSDGSKTTYATYLGGSTFDAAYGIAVDSTGDVYVTGATASSDFPGAGSTSFGGAFYYFGEWAGDAFVAKLDPKGATLLYSTYLGGKAADEGIAVAVDANGNAYVVGGTGSAAWLQGSAAGTYQPAFAGQEVNDLDVDAAGDAFLAKLNSSGKLAWYTYLGGSNDDEAATVTLDNSGNIYVSGNTSSSNFPVAGSPVPDCHIGGRPFLAEFNSTGAKLLMTTGLSGMGYDQVNAIALDTAHSIAYLAGTAESQVFLSTPGAAQINFGGGPQDSFVSRLDLTIQPTFALSCVVNGASYLAGNEGPYPTGAVAPGEIVSLFGLGLGPAAGAGLQLTNSGTVATSIGGMTVLFDGIAAPLLYSASGQINAVVPYGINPTTTNMTVKTSTLTAGPIPMPVDAAVPAIFMCGAYCNDIEQAAVVNSDGTLNTVTNPAARGDYITFYLGGVGLTSDTHDGSVSAAPYAAPGLPVTVTIRGENAATQFVGAAPGFVNGLIQINVFIPTTIDFGSHVPLVVTVGNYTTQDNVTIAVK